MIQLRLATHQDLIELTSLREGETKLGQTLKCIDSLDALESSEARYVLFGIEEDIGIQANYGKKGAGQAWQTFLSSFVNTQSNQYNTGNDVLLLGAVTVSAQLEEDVTKETLGEVVSRIDKKVAFLVRSIVEAGKIPILIGGGHNNAFGALSGTSEALGTSINCINLDAHTDLRIQDYRHSGNGFRYALENPERRFLEKYAIFGVHKNYTPAYILEYVESKNEDIKLYFFEDMFTEQEAFEQLEEALLHISDNAFGLELDCDVIQNFPASALTPSGFTLEQIRLFITKISSLSKITYLHICEASPSKATASQVGKSLTYLVTDFITSHRAHHTL